MYFVRDNGIGFDVGKATALFQPFHRLPSTRQLPGMGLGLAGAKRIVERHGGRIWVERAPGVGSTFLFTLAADEPGG